jgi:hypothetical protein
MPDTHPHRLSKAARLARRLSLSLLIAFPLMEVLLRVIPLRFTDFLSTFQFVGDKDLGYLPVANQDATYNIDCLKNPQVRTNSLGLRGPEWQSRPGKPKIALLGDSFLLALTVSDRLHVANLLQASTDAEVWNAGVSGYGTYQELLAWRKLIKARKPDVTVLFIYLENDIRDNHCGLCRAEGQLNCPCLAVQDGQIVEDKDFELRKPLTGFRAWLKDNCYTCRLLRHFTRPAPPQPPSGYFFDQETFAYNVYRPGHSPRWEEAWQTTAWSLQALKRECDAQGSKLLVANVPGVILVANDLGAELKSQIGTDSVPPGFDRDLPIRRLRAITDAAGIALLDLQPAFIAYRDQHALARPQFGWCCDLHWNPLGHQLAADLVHNCLVDSGWVAGAKRVTGPPQAVLGAEMMREIYGCGVVALE